MLLHEALLQTECPICLQPLNYIVPPPPSDPTSPLYGNRAGDAYAVSEGTSPTSVSHASSTTHSPILLSNALADSEADTTSFRITFAPGVYGSDANDPWHPSFELSAESNGRGHSGATAASASASSPSSTFPPPTHLMLGDPNNTTAQHSTTNTGHSSSTHQGNDKGAGQPHDTAPSEESASGVAVLPCGHLLHYVCALQLCDYATHPSCPVCRTKLHSTADLVLFKPRARRPARSAASSPSAPISSSPIHVESAARDAVRKRKRDSDVCEGQGQQLDGEESNSVTIIADDKGDAARDPHHEDEVLLGATELTNIDVDELHTHAASGAESHNKSESAFTSPHHLLDTHKNDSAPSPSSTVALTGHEETAASPGSPSAPSDIADLRKKHRSSEDDILILGARQLPPAQAYADLILRITASWSDRTAVLKTRVAHLEKSQEQLRSDCAELDHTLSAARRRRELLLNVPASSSAAATPASRACDPTAEAQRSFERLRELRRLCAETRAAATAATAELAASTRAHAEVRRQMEKYTRKLARLDAAEVVEDDAVTERVERAAEKRVQERHRTLHSRRPDNGGGDGGEKAVDA